MIENPYIPAKDFINEVYGKANNIIDLFVEIDIKFGGNIEKKYAVDDLHYGIYYRIRRTIKGLLKEDMTQN